MSMIGEPTAGEPARPVFIGIAGGTGSGKTTVAEAILRQLPGVSILVIPQDAYYKDRSDLPLDERAHINYDHPLAFDTELLIANLEALRRWEPIEMPVYNFRVHNREPYTRHVEPADVVIVEGILILDDARLRELLDIKIYVDTDADVRILRRLLRDIRERGRTVESVVDQYLTSVRPMHLQFVEPSKRYADIIIPEGGENRVAIDVIAAKIENILARRARSSH